MEANGREWKRLKRKEAGDNTRDRMTCIQAAQLLSLNAGHPKPIGEEKKFCDTSVPDCKRDLFGRQKRPIGEEKEACDTTTLVPKETYLEGKRDDLHSSCAGALEYVPGLQSTQTRSDVLK